MNSELAGSVVTEPASSRDSSLHSGAGIEGGSPHSTSIYMDFWDPNSGPVVSGKRFTCRAPVVFVLINNVNY